MCACSDALIAEQVERLRGKPLATIEAETIARRRRWFEERHRGRARSVFGPRPRPRQAFEALFFDYMRFDPRDLPVVSESDDEIVWLSRNPCPTLEACAALGLDTRRVCRQAYDKSTQAFVSQIDPQLRFLRDYDRIRPHADHCHERLVRVDFAAMMRRAIDEASLSKETGNKGYGAVVAIGNSILASAHDTAVSGRDPSAHAELTALRDAVRIRSDPDLCGAVLFSTCEPCPMCAGLAVWSNVSTIVFGASIERTAARGRSRIMLSCREIVARSPVHVEIVPGILEEECLALY
jgi:tRNA(adenine34) deaminase